MRLVPIPFVDFKIYEKDMHLLIYPLFYGSMLLDIRVRTYKKPANRNGV